MKSYDDLQRFKEKTQTNHIEFKDMSEQELNADTTNWAVIKQLLNDDTGSVLGNGQRVDRAAPQPVGPAAFIPPSAHDVPVISQLSVQSFVATTSADSDHVGASLLSDISDSLQPPAPVEVAVPAAVQAAVPADMTPLRATPVAQHTAVSGSSLLAQLAAQPVATPAPPVASPSPVTSRDRVARDLALPFFFFKQKTAYELVR